MSNGITTDFFMSRRRPSMSVMAGAARRPSRVGAAAQGRPGLSVVSAETVQRASFAAFLEAAFVKVDFFLFLFC